MNLEMRASVRLGADVLAWRAIVIYLPARRLHVGYRFLFLAWSFPFNIRLDS